jgi:fatty-acyl-CoA synthase
MAALSLRAGVHFAPDRFYSQILGDLPNYAAPLFVRLLPEQAVTATFKLKKSELEREGFDPRAIADLVFVRNDAARTYEPLDAAAYDAIARGARRL